MSAIFLRLVCDGADLALAGSKGMNHKARRKDVSRPVEVESVETTR